MKEDGQATKYEKRRISLKKLKTLIVLGCFAAVVVFCGSAFADFEVYFMRHGETPWNRAKILQGSIATIDLTSVGVAMAEETAATLMRNGISFDRVYTSPYVRARHTAEILAKASDVKPVEEPRIRERCCGTAEGRPYGDSDGLARNMAAATGVESIEAVTVRVLDFLERELKPLDGKVSRVLCISHTLLLNILEKNLSNGEIRKSLLPNCCLHVLIYRNGRFVLKERAKIFYDEDHYRTTSSNADFKRGSPQ